MSPPIQPQQDFTDLAQLASRIAGHLTLHPNDQQARDDLKYVHSKLAGPSGVTAAANAQDVASAGGTPSAHPGYDIAAGLGEAATDIPRAVGQAILHPIDTAGQMTGIANIPAAWRTFQDPDADWSEKADALIRATPLNLGYAPERALLEATGAKADDPASLEEQAHRAGNVASLALLGVKPMSVVRGGLSRVVGARMLGRVGRMLSESGEPKPAPTAPPVQPETGSPVGGMQPETGAATGGWTRELALKQGVLPENVDAFLARQAAASAPPTPAPVPAVAPTVPDASATAPTVPPVVPPAAVAPQGAVSPPRVTEPLPIPGSPKGISAIGPPTPPPPSAPTVTDIQGGFPALGRGTGNAGNVTAIRLRNGTVLPDPTATIHAEAITNLGVNPADVAGGGFIKPDGSYVESSSHAGPIGERAAAAERVAAKRAARVGTPLSALGKGETLPYYPRGGAAEQALPPPPAESPPPSFEGGGFEGVTRAMQEPAYQHADVLARQAVHFGLGPFAGLSDAAATQLLQRMIVETVRQGKPIPPITTVPKFLERLVS